MVSGAGISVERRRLLLRPMKITDVDAMLRIFADPLVTASFGMPPFERRQVRQWVERNLSHQSKFGYGLSSVILKHNNLLIGDCGLEHADIDGEMVPELGYDFLSDYWHKGLATEAARAESVGPQESEYPPGRAYKWRSRFSFDGQWLSPFANRSGVDT